MGETRNKVRENIRDAEQECLKGERKKRNFGFIQGRKGLRGLAGEKRNRPTKVGKG